MNHETQEHQKARLAITSFYRHVVGENPKENMDILSQIAAARAKVDKMKATLDAVPPPAPTSNYATQDVRASFDAFARSVGAPLSTDPDPPQPAPAADTAAPAKS